MYSWGRAWIFITFRKGEGPENWIEERCSISSKWSKQVWDIRILVVWTGIIG